MTTAAQLFNTGLKLAGERRFNEAAGAFVAAAEEETSDRKLQAQYSLYAGVTYLREPTDHEESRQQFENAERCALMAEPGMSRTTLLLAIAEAWNNISRDRALELCELSHEQASTIEERRVIGDARDRYLLPPSRTTEEDTRSLESTSKKRR